MAVADLTFLFDRFGCLSDTFQVPIPDYNLKLYFIFFVLKDYNSAQNGIFK